VIRSGDLARASQLRGIPVRFGDYEVIEEIGRGAMGIVLKARSPKESRVVAVKTLLHGGARRDVLHRFRREARATSRLRHPNIVAVHEVGEAEDLPYFVMDYVPGTTLDKHLKLHPVIPRQAAAWAMDIARALSYAHGLGVIHRDLKPGNVMLDGDRPVLMDFGLAKDTTSESVLSLSGDVFGTPAYMPPEQAAGHLSEIDARSDLYSLGVILYEMLTGHPPFKGHNLTEMVYKVIHEDPPAPRTLKPRIPADLEAVCLKAMEKEKGRRYRSAEEMIRDLDRFLAHEGVEAPRVTGLVRMGKAMRRKRSVLKAFAAAFALCVLAFGGGWLLMQKRGLDRLAAGLADPLPSIRLKALSDLLDEAVRGRFKPADEGRAWELLAAAAGDADDAVAKTALSATIRLTQDPAQGLSLRSARGFDATLSRQFAHPNPEVAEAAVICAGRLEVRGTYDALLPLLQSPRRSLRVAAVRSLGQLGMPEALLPLMALLRRDRPLTLEVTHAMNCLYAGGMLHPLIATRSAAPDVLHATRSVNEILEGIMEADTGDKADPVARGLALLRDPARRQEERLQAAYELARLGDRKAVPDLLACLTMDPEPVGLQAAWAAEELGGRPVVDGLLDLLAAGGAKERARAALALGRPGNPAISQALMHALAADPDSQTAEALCRALGRTEDGAASEYLIRAAERGDAAMRACALASLRTLKGKDLGEEPAAYRNR
jgi:HEAT repeat protein/tRNA A-37 threonylcarbamoyl transferase component Bud32